MTFSECVKKLHDYLTCGIIIAAGSLTRIYLHRKHVRSWLIYSIRFRQRDNNNNSQMVSDQFELLSMIVLNNLETVQVPLKKAIEKQTNLYSDDEHERDQNIQYDRDNDSERILFKTNYDNQQTTLYCFPTYDCLAKFSVSFPSSLINQQRGTDRMPFPSYQ
ncbi:unnamed protein product [Rotaria magnacalcarata]|uniref:Uncharacterized protein n=1 Tax=Rotaria magnacalcarata TaxID=392030 RepID=A0A8S2QS98_9BILA|nr:unnamed protein product [Rotaria magnacalcarata]